METTTPPTFAQLIKQAIDNRLLDVHTAIIGQVEHFDHTTQLVDIEPVLKQTHNSKDGSLKQARLPLLVDVPVVFPKAGGYFISLPIQKGDYVQVIFNETSIDEFLTEKASTIDSAGRFTLQGAVAIPGMTPLSKPLSSAHKTNFVAGKDGGVQIHIDGEKIRLGSEKADEALALASKVKRELEKIIEQFNDHSHRYMCKYTGTPEQTGSPEKMPAPASVAAQKVVAE